MAKTQEAKVQNQENTQAMQTTNQQTGLAQRDFFSPSFFGGSSPFALMQRFRDEVNRLFEDFGFGRSLMPSFGRDLFSHTFGDFGTQSLWSPQVEMFEREGKLIVRADLPGLNKDDVKVELTDNALTISGERRSEHEEKREGYYHTERSYGSFFRQIPLPEGVNADNAEATFNNGVLEISMNAPEKKQTGRRLEIRDASQK